MFTERGAYSQTRMLIRVHATPNAREVSVTKVDESLFEVRVDERAINGRANKRLLEIMAKYLGVPKSKVFIVRGAKTRDKIIEVLEPDEKQGVREGSLMKSKAREKETRNSATW